MKQLIGIIVLVAAIIGGAVLLSGSDEETAGAASNNFYGKEDASVVITEYGDFECPACAQFFPVVDTVKQQFEDRVKLEFKHFPLVQIHPNAIAAHRAAEAAAKQGQFWEMHDLLYERQPSWAAQSTGAGGFSNTNAAEPFEGYAQELGLDVEQFKADVASSETIGTVNADIAEGRALGAESTPTFLLNGEIIDDLNSLATVEGFTALIEEALAEAEGTESTESTSEATSEDARPEEEATTEE